MPQAARVLCAQRTEPLRVSAHAGDARYRRRRRQVPAAQPRDPLAPGGAAVVLGGVVPAGQAGRWLRAAGSRLAVVPGADRGALSPR